MLSGKDTLLLGIYFWKEGFQASFQLGVDWWGRDA